MVLKGYGSVPLEYLEVPDSSKTATVIFLPGVGSTGKEVKNQFLEHLGNDAYIDHIKFVFLTPPTGLLSYLSKETTMWFNSSPAKLPNYRDIRSSLNYVDGICRQEVNNGTPPERIILGGFSQGGCIAMGVGFLRFPELRGVANLSGYYDPIFQEVCGNKFPQLFHAHSSNDYLMSIDKAKKGFEYLQSRGVKGKMFVHEGIGHVMDPASLIELYKFIKNILPPISI